MFNDNNKVYFKELLNEYYKSPFLYYKNYSIFNEIKNKYISKGDNIKTYIEYVENQWIQYFRNGMLNYHYLTKEQRSNSYIENYNRKIKLKLSKFLYGKNKCKVTWPLFYILLKMKKLNRERKFIIMTRG